MRCWMWSGARASSLPLHSMALAVYAQTEAVEHGKLFSDLMPEAAQQGGESK